MSKQTNETEQLTLRAKLLKRQTKAKQQTELNRRRVARGKSPSITATLKSINAYKKLIMYTECKQSMETLLLLDEKYYKADGRSPIWVKDDSDGVYFKVSIPKFMQNKLYEWCEWAGSTVSITLAHKSYSSEEYGQGWYLTLNGPLKQLEDPNDLEY